jgi:3-hydroxyisobutyrate dehydrogenase-like beta-hydroxyacid dehydrogenase
MELSDNLRLDLDCNRITRCGRQSGGEETKIGIDLVLGGKSASAGDALTLEEKLIGQKQIKDLELRQKENLQQLFLIRWMLK